MDNRYIMWLISVSSITSKESLKIELGGKSAAVWLVSIEARSFETADALRELACRRLGLQDDSFRKVQQFQANNNNERSG